VTTSRIVQRIPLRSDFFRTQAGYSLYDLIVTSAVVGTLSIGTAGMVGMVQNSQITSEINELMAHLNLARSEAIVRGQEVVLCPSMNGSDCDDPKDGYAWWHSGYLMFVNMDENADRASNEPIIRAHQASPGRISIKSSKFRSRVTYRANGLSSGSTATFTFCGAHEQSPARYVILSNTGRPRVSPIPSDGKADEESELCS